MCEKYGKLHLLYIYIYIGSYMYIHIGIFVVALIDIDTYRRICSGAVFVESLPNDQMETLASPGSI